MKKQKQKKANKMKNLSLIFSAFWKYGKLYVLITLFCSAILQPLQTSLFTLLPKIAIDSVVKGISKKELVFIIALFALILCVIGVTQKILTTVYSQYTNGMIIQKIKSDLNKKALYTDYKYYDDPKFYSSFAYALEHFPEQASVISYVIPMLLKDIVTLVAMSAIIFTADAYLVLISLFFIILSAFVDFKAIQPANEYSRKEIEIWKPFHYAMRSINEKENAAELRASNAGKNLLDMANKSFDTFKNERKVYTKKMLPFVFLQGLLSPIQTVAVLFYVVVFIIDGDVQKIGLYASLTAATTVLSGNLSGLFSNINILIRHLSQFEGVAEFLNLKSEIEPIDETKAVPPDDLFDIRLSNVSFCYGNDEPTLNNIDLHIKAGQKIAIVGENGAGKTTLTKLLLRLYDVNSGEIVVNGLNIKDYELHKLRMRIGTAFQNERILALTLRENLTVYHNATDEQLEEVIHKLGLDKVYNNSDGLDTTISKEFEENGLVLSGGETQRLAVARLFTGQFGLLILDEPSSALDPLAEAKLMEHILDVSNTATTVMVAHRLSTVRDFDVIYYLENGQIAESGTHDALMKAQGKYYKMFQTQGKNYQISNTEYSS